MTLISSTKKKVFLTGLFLCGALFATTGFFRVKSQTPEDVFLIPSATEAALHQKAVYRKILGVADNPAARERAQIDYLIEVMRKSPYTFIRNGVEHSGARGAAHLIWKYHRKLSKVHSVQSFIDEIATRSSLSGELYLVKLEEGKTYPLRELLTNEWQRLESSLKEDRGSTDNP